jgi:hypothetical protein
MNWSASSIPRLLECPTSALLPQHDYKTEYAEQGTDYHADQEAAIDVGDEDAIHPDVLALIREGDETITEMAFAYDPIADTARELGRITREQYAALVKPGELPGKPDLVIRGNGRLLVVDHKGHEEVEDAERNAQVATYALMVARAYGYDECEVAIVYRATYRRPTHATLNALDLAAHGDRLNALRADIEKARETPQLFLSDGAHCKYCPAFLGGCPRMESLQRRVAGGDLVRRAEQLIPFNDDESASRGLDLLERLKMLTARLSAALYARAAERPIPRGDGKVFAQVIKEGNRKLDGDAAYALLREKYGQEVADKAVTRSATQKGIETALKAAGVKGASAKKDAIVDALEEAGKVERKPKTSFETVPAEKLLKESA